LNYPQSFEKERLNYYNTGTKLSYTFLSQPRISAPLNSHIPSMLSNGIVALDLLFLPGFCCAISIEFLVTFETIATWPNALYLFAPKMRISSFLGLSNVLFLNWSKPLSPADNSSDIGRILQFDWQKIEDATNYTFELATNPAFGSYTVVEKTGIVDSFYHLENLIDQNTIYYWRVTAGNKCSEKTTNTFAFATLSKYCQTYDAVNLPKNITQSGTPTVEAIFDIASTSTVLDVNVEKVYASHGFISDLTGWLVSPSGTERRLWHRKCSNLSTISCGFDDESVAPIQCPMVNIIFPPNQLLTDFIGEPVDGQWLLRIKDNVGGDGGTFKEAKLEICTASSLNNPYLITNNPLGVKPADKNLILNSFLEVGDDDNTAEELTFTVVRLPLHGNILINGSEAVIGSQFTQADINNKLVLYTHNGDDVEMDDFEYTVIDGEGGWISKTLFTINIGSEYPTAINDLALDKTFSIFPNPSSDLVNIQQLGNDNLDYNLMILDVIGNTILKQEDIKTKIHQVDLSLLNSGIYMVKINVDGKNTYQKLNIIR